MEDLIEDWDMLDISPQRGKFTWMNMRTEPGHIAARLNRFIVHNNFLQRNETLKYYIIPSIISDHKPISLHLQAFLNYGPLPFQFKPLWLNHQEAINIVETIWRTWIPGTPIFIWEQKIILVK